MAYWTYVEFAVLRDDGEGNVEPATAEEVAQHVRLKVVRPGWVEVETDPGYSLGLDVGGED